jgi:2-polyprenyl-3-methyl-5-hydroxy-6-metoxy-1,4-benzoquinol methylase
MKDPTINIASYPCPICRTTTTRPRYTVAGFSIVSCTSCGMVYVNPRIVTDDLFNIYRNEYFNRGRRGVESGYENYELTATLRIKTFNKWYADIKRFFPAAQANAQANALDIGCAAGYFLELLKKDGWKNVEAIELDTGMLQGLRSRRHQVSDLPLEQFVPARRYGLITLFDVLEHLPELNHDFAKLSAMLDEKGIIALVTPDFGSFQRKLFGKRWFQFKPREHIYYFTEKTLKTLAARHGLSVVHLAASGQYADYAFLHDRLVNYRFTLLDRAFIAVCTLCGIKNRFWYMDTGSMFAVLRKK